MKITQTRKEFKKGYTKGGKEKWILIEESQEEIDETTYYKMIKNRNPFGYERQRKSYTRLGYTTTYICCISPSRSQKITYDFMIE